MNITLSLFSIIVKAMNLHGYGDKVRKDLCLCWSRSHDPNDMTYYTMLTFPHCVEGNLQKDLSINKIEFDHESDDPTINVKLQAEAETDIQAI
ncbi:hypothetical protein [Wolbachia endosymbiont of Mansonella perstans]|uniref:hypothetical protein n=1 Tax=Wolbachia endosymbiont of Mansonella perstans TaxID=229526 RepID=UPI001CE11F82|nr:hypothetical protein [Wolbachia endosymbiont of Mansonella perstans]MCA4774015.1 hypothetical protein [Wolbachia endosymbiont of Mansonella perstans]